MIFSEGLPKQYSLLRNRNPAIFYLEDFHFKILQLNVDKDYSVFLNNSELEEDEDINSSDNSQTRKTGSFNSTPTLNQYGTDLTKKATDILNYNDDEFVEICIKVKKEYINKFSNNFKISFLRDFLN